MTNEWDHLNSQIVFCRLCPRLVRWREQVAREKRRAFREWTYWGRPIPGFGDPNARVVILGLAPAAHGGNRTGRIFTGDSSGATLMGALYRAGFANQPSSAHAYDGLQLHDAFITAIVRCAPPDNKPTPQEILNCRPYLAREFELLKHSRVVIALGKIACDGYLAHLRGLMAHQLETSEANEHQIHPTPTSHPRHYLRSLRVTAPGHVLPRVKFGHGAVYVLGQSLPTLICSYHPSQQNTNTGRLTNAMLDDVFEKAKQELKPIS